MEIDIDDVPWKDDIISDALDIKDGSIRIPSRPGWGADLNDREIAKHPWTK
jgi:L-alanine-DL-glutamate epimerase-like enolase superfamily enzyme